MNKLPAAVSVLMTAYNREKYIAEAIESVLNSTFQDFELIIVDDCSSDNTVAVARTYEKDLRVKVYVNEQNLGDYPNRNRAASYAKGKYIKYVDSDDLIYPFSLEAFVWGMEREPSAAIGICENVLPENKPYPQLIEPRNAYKEFFLAGKFFYEGPSSVIIKRNVFEEIGGFSGKPYVGDTELWLKIAALYPVVQLPKNLFWWRVHEGQQIKEGSNNNYYRDILPKLFHNILKAPDCPLSGEEKLRIMRNIKTAKLKKAIKLLLQLNIQESFANFRIVKGLD